ncbi:hypothetical protein M9H77_14077 [Catharanthus roseus]|uniref:Uncharacterized protein n=1 Tax=Catharanthus roseus TaxID=4058 RepID=A0ACC0BM64_CATRO|nr:hypothetical protein M9H77_14077 [Catharanthus roseus]
MAPVSQEDRNKEGGRRVTDMQDGTQRRQRDKKKKGAVPLQKAESLPTAAESDLTADAEEMRTGDDAELRCVTEATSLTQQKKTPSFSLSFRLSLTATQLRKRSCKTASVSHEDRNKEGGRRVTDAQDSTTEKAERQEEERGCAATVGQPRG